MTSTLLLNASYEPLSVISWQRAMTLFCQDKVEVVREHDETARSVTFTFRLPAVVRLLRFVRIARKHADHVPFTRANIYARDRYMCQYCGGKFKRDALTFDHVVPIAQGGGKSWDNIVTACEPCNRTKAGRTPDEAGMTLLSQPRVPPASPIFKVTIGMRTTPESWREFLYWNVELEDS